MMKQELHVITKTRDMIQYVFLITDNAPKKFRFTLITRLQNYSLSILENEIRANEVYQTSDKEKMVRYHYQKQALIDCKLMGTISLVSFEQRCITAKQYEQISGRLSEIVRMLYGWMNSSKGK